MNHFIFQKYLHRGKHQCHHCSLFFQSKEMLDLHIVNDHVTDIDSENQSEHFDEKSKNAKTGTIWILPILTEVFFP